MFNKQAFHGKVIAAGYTLTETAKAIGINPATLSKKMSGTSDFTREEIIKIRDLLGLTGEEVEHIFFS